MKRKFDLVGETLEEKLKAICGSKKAKEVINVFANHFEIDELELKLNYSAIKITSDNSLIGTELKFGRKEENLPVHSIQWNIGGNEDIGKLTLVFF